MQKIFGTKFKESSSSLAMALTLTFFDAASKASAALSSSEDPPSAISCICLAVLALVDATSTAPKSGQDHHSLQEEEKHQTREEEMECGK